MGRLDTLRDGARRAAFWASTPGGLAWLFASGLILRLVLARGGGFPFDVSSFQAWASRLAEREPWGFYPAPGENYFVDYPPGYLYVLWIVGKITRGAPSVFMIKLPAILADLALAAVAVRLSSRLTAPAVERQFPWRGVVAAALLFNPAIFFVSGTWGQVDSVLALCVAGAFLFLGTGPATLAREAAGIALMAVAILVKPQAVFALPVVLLLLVWRHVRGEVVSRPSGRGAFQAAGTGLARVAGLGFVGLGTMLLLAAPFGLGLRPVAHFPFVDGSLIDRYLLTTRTYKATSVFAFNFWGAGGFWQPDLPAPDAPNPVRIAGIPALYIGLALFAVGLVVLGVRAWRSLNRGELEGRVLTFGGAAVTCMSFAVLTRMHERYLFLALALLAPLVAYRVVRNWFLVLSALYFVNVYFPYVYYTRREGRSAIVLPGFESLYGTPPDGAVSLETAQFTLLSLVTGVVCLWIAWRGWVWMRARTKATEAVQEDAEMPPADDLAEARPARTQWAFTLHPLTPRTLAFAALVFVGVALLRLPGLGSPHAMYFDEVYHARTAGEYLEGRDVYEWTHPPLAKELIAVSILGLNGLSVRGESDTPAALERPVVASGKDAVAWATARGRNAGTVQLGSVTDSCELSGRLSVPVSLSPTAVFLSGARDGVVGGTRSGGPVIARFENGRETWRVPIDGTPRQVAVAAGAVFAITEDDNLWRMSLAGESAEAVAGGAGAIAIPPDASRAWVSFPDESNVASYAATGEPTASVEVPDEPVALTSAGNARLIVAGRIGGLDSIDTEANPPNISTSLPAVDANILVQMPDSDLAWAVNGSVVRAIEPRGMAVYGRTQMPKAAEAVLASDQRLAAVTSDGLVCVSGRFSFAWRFASLLFGAAIAALAMLLAVRLFGSVAAGLLAALFVAVDGLAYTLARIAMNDSFVVAFILAAWLGALSVLYHWGRSESGDRSRLRAILWLAATGVFAGAAVASKWVGLWGLTGIAVLFVWDAITRGQDGVLSLGGGKPGGRLTAARSWVLAALLLGVLPIGVYILTYIPYFELGRSFGELVALQQQMYGYHANLDASHPFSSPWYGWPLGRKPVFLYLNDLAQRKAEIWTLGNPVVFIGGFVALVASGIAAYKRRSAVLAVPAVAAAVQYLPWVLIGRVLFLYHYFPVVPFGAIALAWWLTVGRHPEDPRRRKIEMWAAAAAAVVLFGAMLPLLDGWYVPPSYITAVKSALFWIRF